MQQVRRPVNPFIRYPLYFSLPSVVERTMVALRRGMIKCLVCGNWSVIAITSENLRETCVCRRCGATNRQRQVAAVMLHSLANHGALRSLRDVAAINDIVVYNTEARGPLHEALSGMHNYLCSEYYGPDHESGALIGNVMHQDLMRLSLADQSVDLMISSDVFEHIAEPYQAHREVHRVLKPGGRHIFTIPFWEEDYLDDRRASIDETGRIVHHRAPIYHEDPVSQNGDGALVFTIFSLEMLTKLAQIGFKTNMFLLYQPRYGIIGPNAIVFEAIKGYRPEWEMLGLR